MTRSWHRSRDELDTLLEGSRSGPAFDDRLRTMLRGLRADLRRMPPPEVVERHLAAIHEAARAAARPAAHHGWRGRVGRLVAAATAKVAIGATAAAAATGGLAATGKLPDPVERVVVTVARQVGVELPADVSGDKRTREVALPQQRAASPPEPLAQPTAAPKQVHVPPSRLEQAAEPSQPASPAAASELSEQAEPAEASEPPATSSEAPAPAATTDPACVPADQPPDPAPSASEEPSEGSSPSAQTTAEPTPPGHGNRPSEEPPGEPSPDRSTSADERTADEQPTPAPSPTESPSPSPSPSDDCEQPAPSATAQTVAPDTDVVRRDPSRSRLTGWRWGR